MFAQTAIKIENLKCGYPSGFYLQSISLQFNKGTVSALVGPNGSGKSTLLKAATGILPIGEGIIEIDGISLCRISREQLAKKIAVVAQENIMPFEMNVLEYVQLGRIPHRNTFSFHTSRKDYEIAMKKLEMTGAAEFATRGLNELSGGERQLIHMARALAQETDIIFFDEPTNHLDISHQQSIMRIVRNLAHEEGLAIILILHDLNLASQFCDTVHLLNGGKLIASGPPEAIIEVDLIAKVYGVNVRSIPNPQNGKPLIFIS